MKRLLLIALLLLIPTVRAQDEDAPIYYVTDDGGLAVMLPPGWAAEGNADIGLNVGNGPDVLAKFRNDEALAPGEAGFGVVVLDAELRAAWRIRAGISLEELLSSVLYLMIAGDEVPIAESFEFAGRPAARTVLSETAGGDFVAVLWLVAPRVQGLAVVGAAPGELDAMEAELLDVLATVRYSPPLEGTYSDAQRFDYPQGWTATSGERTAIVLRNESDVGAAAGLEAGQFEFRLYPDNFAAGLEAGTIQSVAEGFASFLGDPEAEVEPTITLTVAEREVALVRVDGTGGWLATALPHGMAALSYQAAPGEAHLVELMAINTLLSLEEWRED